MAYKGKRVAPKSTKTAPESKNDELDSSVLSQPGRRRKNISSDEKKNEPKNSDTKKRPKGKRVKKSRRKKFIIIAVILIVLVAAAIIAGLYVIENMKPTLAKAQPYATYTDTKKNLCEPFVEEDVTCSIKYVIDNDSKRGKLLNQSPKPDTKSDSVKLTYSQGPKMVNVPIVTGLSKNKALQEIWESGLTIGETMTKNASIPKNTVIESSLEPAIETKNGSSIDLVYSTGMISIPDWIGKTKEYILAKAKNDELLLKINKKVDKKTPDTVINQDDPGKLIPFDQPIHVTISKESATAKQKIPKVKGKTKSDAISILASQGFTKITIKIMEDKKAKKKPSVVSISPKAGKKTSTNSEVTLTIAEKPKKK